MEYKKAPSEEQEQQELVAWFKRTYGPELAKRLHHSPNGGHRNKATAARMKYLGVRKGFPDLVLYLPRGGFVGCVLELKQTGSGNDCSDDQYDWINWLAECGFDCWGPVDGFAAGTQVLTAYMELDPPPTTNNNFMRAA